MMNDMQKAIDKDIEREPHQSPDEQYNVIYADPPWPMKKSIRRVRPNQVDMDYPTMSVDEIRAMSVCDISADNATLFLWTTHRFLPDALSVMDAWGFKYQRVVTWDKGNGMCLFGFHHRTEMLLFGYKGKLDAFPRRRAFPTMVAAKSKRHSAKPSVFRELIEPFGDTRIELFARERAEGWDSWGNEV